MKFRRKRWISVKWDGFLENAMNFLKNDEFPKSDEFPENAMKFQKMWWIFPALLSFPDGCGKSTIQADPSSNSFAVVVKLCPISQRICDGPATGILTLLNQTWKHNQPPAPKETECLRKVFQVVLVFCLKICQFCVFSHLCSCMDPGLLFWIIEAHPAREGRGVFRPQFPL